MKLTFLQTEEAFGRSLYGESVRSIARSMAVTEGALRFHFRKGKSPKEVRRLAFDLVYAQQLRDSLTPGERAEVARLVAKAEKANPPDWRADFSGAIKRAGFPETPRHAKAQCPIIL